MNEIGDLLREAREARGLTLAEAHQKTRISTNLLESIEAGRFDELPTQVHARGYIRNYARYLGLDPQPLLDRYDLSLSQQPQMQMPVATEPAYEHKPLSPVEEQPFFDPVNMELSGAPRAEGGSLQRWIIILALVITIGLIANRFIPIIRGDGDGTDSLSNSIQNIVGDITNSNAEESPETEPTLDISQQQVITSTSRNAAAIQLPTPSPTRPVLQGVLDHITLRLDITERTWMRVTIDGEVMFEGLARKGDEPYIFEADEEAQVRTGNAAGIFVTINDVELGKLGGRAEVVDQTWSTTVAQ